MVKPTLGLASDKTVVSIFVDDTKKVVSTDAGTVGQVLERADIKLHEHDLVEPSADSEFTSEIFNINIYRAKPVVVIDGGNEIKVNTPYQNPKLIAERSAGLKVFPEDQYQTELIRDVLSGGIGMKVQVQRATPVALKIDGFTLPLRTQAETVQEMFDEKGIVVSDSDKVSYARNATLKANMVIAVTRIGKSVVAEEEAIPYTTDTIYDGNRPVGYEEIRQAGKPGRRLVTYEITHGNGSEISRVELQSVTIRQPVAKVVVRGSKAAFGAHADAFLQLRICESGNNYAANTGNGYYGAYQFHPNTWQSLGYSGLPHRAPPPVQDDAARQLQARSGWGQWPSCAAQLNLY